MMKNTASNLGLFLVFGLLVGLLFDNLSLGVLGGLVCHLIINNFHHRNKAEE